MSAGTSILSRFAHAAAGGEPAAARVRWLGAGLLAAAVFFNDAVFRVLDADRFSFDWQVALRLAMCGACGLFGLAHLRRTREDLLRFPAAWAVLLVVWAMATAVRAVDVRYAMASAVALGCMVLFAAAVLRVVGGRQIVLAIGGALLAFLAASWVVYFAVPSLGRTEFILPNLDVQYRMGGLAHANALGKLAGLLALFVLAAGRDIGLPRRAGLSLLVLALVTLAMTASRPAMIATAAAAAMLGWRRLGTGRMVGLGLGLLILASLVGLAGSFGLIALDVDALLAKVSRSGEADAIYSFTGRTGIWEFVAGKIAESPLLGYGYGCSRFLLTGSEEIAVFHAHNQLLNAALEMGVVGAILLAVIFLGQLGRMVFRGESLPDAVALFVVVGGLTDRLVLSPIPDACTIAWLIALFWRGAGCSLREPPAPVAAAEV